MRELTACKRSVNRNYCDEVELELTACEEVGHADYAEEAVRELTASEEVELELTAYR